MATLPGGSCCSFCCCAAVLGVITLKPDATSMLSLFWVLLVVAQPTVNANRVMTLITLNEVRICFIFIGSWLMILICRFRRSLATAQTNRFALRLARDSAQTGQIVRLAGVYANGTLVVLLLGRASRARAPQRISV